MKIFFLMLLIFQILYSGVRVEVNKEEVTIGEELIITIVANGKDIQFTQIKDIGGFLIEQSGKSQNIQIINGIVQKSESQTYVIRPDKSFEIEPFEILIDGQKEKTEKVKITIKQPSQTKNQDFSLEISSDKTTSFVGEQVNIKLLFKRHKNQDILDLEYTKPTFKDFWVKQIGKENKYQLGDYIVYELNYVAFPQKSGELTLEPAKMRVAMSKDARDLFGFFVKQPEWKTLFSNNLKFNILPLPENVSLVGDFNISLDVDEKVVNTNEPIQAKLLIQGIGNIDDVEDINLDIKNSSVYGDKSEKKFVFENGVYKGSYEKKFAIISDTNFTIPKISIKYFDTQSKSIKTIFTKELSIEVLNNKTNSKPTLEKQEIIIQEDSNKFYFILIGFIIGVLLTLIAKSINFQKKKKDISINTKNQKEMLNFLLPFWNRNNLINETILKLEENIYQNKKNPIDKKTFKKLILELP